VLFSHISFEDFKKKINLGQTGGGGMLPMKASECGVNRATTAHLGN